MLPLNGHATIIWGQTGHTVNSNRQNYFSMLFSNYVIWFNENIEHTNYVWRLFIRFWNEMNLVRSLDPSCISRKRSRKKSSENIMVK